MKIPSHLAIIMDGNGRWAQEKGLSRREGHKAGVNTLHAIVKKTAELGILCLTVYAFSTENWKRPIDEVEFLMDLFKQTLLEQSHDLFENNVKVTIIGRRKGLSKEIIKVINWIEDYTAKNDGLQLNIALNYGGRAEIFDSIKGILKEVEAGLKIDQLSEDDLNKYLYNSTYPDVELLIRTGGEQRLSNFLLWQNAYAEFYFIDKYWPDFSVDDLIKAINIYQARERRFGALTKVGDK